MFLFNCFIVVFSFAGDLLFHLAHLAAAALIHKQLLENVMKLKMSFFDANPIGRVLSRFAKDIEIFDEMIPWLVADSIFCTVEVYI